MNLYAIEKGKKRTVIATCREKKMLEVLLTSTYPTTKGYHIVKYTDAQRRTG